MVMKKYLLLYKVLMFSLPAFAQLNIPSGTQWVNTGNVTINVSNLDIINKGAFSAGTGVVKFTGNTTTNIDGTSAVAFYQMDVAKTAGSKLMLLSDVNINNQLNFTSGLLDLNQKNLTLASTAVLNNENENSRIIAPSGGEAVITLDLNAPNAVNPGNLGAIISSAVSLGSVTIKRGHLAQSGTGLNGSILRYYNITPQNNITLNSTLRFKYFDAEKNGKDENNFALFQSDDNGLNWTNQSQSTTNSANNYVEKTGLNSLSRFTLSDNTVVANCSATGVALSVKAGKQSSVNVSWSTATETNNQGFGVERRLKGEAGFTQLSFVNSKAAGGNSSSQLNYSYTDVNSSNDTSYYRLKIIGLNASICYSDIKIFVPKVGGKKGGGNPNIINTDTVQTFSISKNSLTKQTDMIAKLTVGPNPNNGNFWFRVSGIDKETFAMLYTMDGKVLKQFRVSNLQEQKVSDLQSGIYILKVDGLQSFKIIVQSGGNSTNHLSVTNTPSIKN